MFFSKKKLNQSEQIISNLLNAQDDGIIVVRNTDCQILFVNEKAQVFLEASPDFSLSQACKISLSKIIPGICSYCQSERTVKFETKDANGESFLVAVHAIQWADEKPAVLLNLHSLKEENLVKQRLFNLAYLDSLTQVPNRQRFKEDFEALEDDIAQGRKNGIVAILDLDNFKSINDTYGHSTGDMMLKRFTQHLQSDPAFNKHIYRLGGDEFALLYADPVGHIPDLKHYYNNLLKGIINSYSMPIIDINCTVSMGVAFFPQHGGGASELLRKADIALYKAKAAGRNQFIFFDEKYELAKKVKDVYINILPILSSTGNTFGYELVDNGASNNTTNNTVNSVNLTESNRTIDALGLDDIANNKHYFINYTKQMLNYLKQNQLNSKFIIQIHLNEPYKDTNLEDYKKIHALGFSLAINCQSATYLTTQLIDIADYIKFAPHENHSSVTADLIAQNPEKIFIANKINTLAQLLLAKKYGFTLFQGFYFNEEARPLTQKTKTLEPLKANYLHLLKLTCTDQYVDFNEISKIISADLALSYQLLKLINSAATGLRYRVSSISMAVAYMGESSIKKWISILSLRGIAPDKPLEMVRLSLVRARFGELLAPHLKINNNPSHIFMLGMLSLLHVALDKNQEDLLSEIPLDQDIHDSLATPNGKYSGLLKFLKSYEYGNWDEVNSFAEEHEIDSETINALYMSTIKWYNDLMEESSM